MQARFARDVQRRMNELAQRLEKDLGPGTAALCVRIGKGPSRMLLSSLLFIIDVDPNKAPRFAWSTQVSTVVQ